MLRKSKPKKKLLRKEEENHQLKRRKKTNRPKYRHQRKWLDVFESEEDTQEETGN